MTTPTSEILNKAADLIEQKGWVRGIDGWYGDHGLCLEGAIGAAMGHGVNSSMWSEELNFQCPAGLAVRSYLDMPLDGIAARRAEGGYWLCHWNDKDRRTASEVIEVLRATAVIEAARENSSVTEKVSAR